MAEWSAIASCKGSRRWPCRQFGKAMHGWPRPEVLVDIVGLAFGWGHFLVDLKSKKMQKLVVRSLSMVFFEDLVGAFLVLSKED